MLLNYSNVTRPYWVKQAQYGTYSHSYAWSVWGRDLKSRFRFPDCFDPLNITDTCQITASSQMDANNGPFNALDTTKG